jgi:hypothetical protein
MAQRKHALIDLVMNDEVARYVGIIQSMMFKLLDENTRQRALLELLTDEPWDTYNFQDENGELRRIAVDALERRLGMAHTDAVKEVERRFRAHNTRPDGLDTSTFLAGSPTFTGPVVPEANPIAPPGDVGYDYEKHLRGLELAAKNREAQRDQL